VPGVDPRPDTTVAWSCAANLSLYDEDPGGESRMVDRRVALIDLYARQLLVRLDADIARLDVVAAESRREEKHTRTLRWSRETAQNRDRSLPPAYTPLRRLRRAWKVWSAYTPGNRREMAQVWEIAAELADTARQRIIEAGAERDQKARDRLLASTNHTLTAEILNVFLPPEVHQQRAAELAETLEEIDQRPEPGR
jgi:hypothetical protein